MKVKILILLLCISCVVSAQLPNVPGYVTRNTREHLVANATDGTQHIPAGALPALNGGWARSGALFVDTVGGGAGLWYYLSGTWYHVLDSANSGKTFGVNDVLATGARAFDRSSYDFNISGTGKLQIGTPISGADGTLQIRNQTPLTQHAAIGNAHLSNNVYVQVYNIDTLTTANNKSTGLYNRYKHVVNSNITISGWGFGNDWMISVPDTMRADPVGSDLAGGAIFRTLLEPNTAVATGRHVIKGGTFNGDYVSAVIAIMQNDNTTSSNWIYREGDWAGVTAHYVTGNAKDSARNVSWFHATALNTGNIKRGRVYHVGPIGNVDTLIGYSSPYTGAYFHHSGTAYFGSQSTGTDYFAAASALAEFYSTTKGVLLPRMTATQKNAISSPATGLIVYDTDSAYYFQYNGSGWEAMKGSGGGSGSQTWQQTLTTGSTLTTDNSIAGGGFNFYHTNTANYRVYGTGSYSSERLLVTSGAAGVAILGRESTNVYYQGSDSLYTVGLGQMIDTTTWKVAVVNSSTGALARSPWLFAGGGTDWSLSGNAATAGSQTGSFLGTTNSVQLRIRTNNAERAVWDSAIAQLRINGATRNTTDGIIVQAPGNGNYDGIKVYANGGVTPLTYGQAGLTRGGGYDFNTSSGSISFSPAAGVYFGTAFTAATARIHIAAGSTSQAPMRFTSGSLTTGGNILAGNVEFLTDKWYATISTGPAVKEFTLNDAALTSGTFPVATTNGRLTNSTFTTTNLISNSGLTPASTTSVNNLDAAGVTNVMFMRVGNVVFFSCKINVDPTLTATSTQIRFTPPIASAFTTADQAYGVATCATIAGMTGSITSDATNDELMFTFISTDINSNNFTVTGSYIVL